MIQSWVHLLQLKTSSHSHTNPNQVHGLAVVAFSLAWFTLPQTATKGQLSAKRWRSPLWVSALVLAVPLHKLFSSPILSHPFSGPYVHPKAPITIHSVVESVTGLIVVGEIIPTSVNQSLDDNMHSVRFLRADHSFLGGQSIATFTLYRMTESEFA